ncbi:PAS domain S-box protein [Pseudochelatococcus sp. B33]
MTFSRSPHRRSPSPARDITVADRRGSVLPGARSRRKWSEAMPTGFFPGIDLNRGSVFSNNIMLHRVRSFDWTSTPVGAVESWPEELRGVCRTALLSATPMSVLIGRNGIVLFNDAVHSLFGSEFDFALGKPVAEVLPHAAGFYEEILARIFAGRPSSFHDLPFKLQREGRSRTAWFDLDFTPIADADGRVLGALVISIETTARVQALRDLQASRERLDLALQSGGIVGAWELDLATNIVRADERYARLHGVDPEMARVGADDSHFVAGIHPDEVDWVMKVFEQAKIDGTYRCQHRVVGPDGTRWVVCSGRFRYGANGAPVTFTGTAVDVTEQVETAAALAESEKKFRTYAETLPQVIFSWDSDGRTTYVNRRWHEFTGLEEGNPLAWNWPSFLHPDDKDLVIADWHRAIDRGVKHDVVARLRHHSRDYRWMHMVALPLHGEGGVTSWLGTLTDVHDAKLLETERELVSKELDHRIKNFFAVAQGLVSLTLRENHSVETFAERLRGRLATLHQSHTLIRSANGMMDPHTAPSLHELIRRLLAPYEVAAREERFTIEGDDVPLDPGRITAFALVFHELATNAAKYGALSAAEGSIQLLSSALDNTLRLDWKENGGALSSCAETDSGFGSRLISLVVEGQLHGHFQRIVEPDGIRVVLDLPNGNVTGIRQ